MKKLAWIAAPIAVAALAACSGGEKAPEAVETATPTAMDGGPASGTYQVTSGDGTVLTQILVSDGTQVTTDADGKSVNGQYTLETPERYCRLDEGDADWTCYSETITEDGTWTATNEADPDEVWTVVRVE